MPETTAPVAPPAAPPPAAPAAAPAPAKTDVNVPELMKMLMRDVSAEEESGDAEISKKKKEELAAPASHAAAKPAPAAAAPAAEPEIKVRRPKKERPPLPVANEPPRAVAPAARPATATEVMPDPEAGRKFEEGLEENEREMLTDAKFLESKWPAKYKGMAARVEKFLKEHIELTQKPDFDDQDPEYQRWVAENQPKLSRAEIRQIEQERIADGVRKENDGRFADLHFRTFAKEKEPEVDQVGRSAYAEMTNASLPDEVGTVLREQIAKLGPQKGYEEALKTHRMEIETAEGVLAAAADDIKEFHRLNVKDPQTGRTLSEFIDDPARDSSPGKEKYQQHQRLAAMVDGVCEEFKDGGGEDVIRDGKWFVTRKEWLRLRPDARGRFWTFTNKEIVDRAKRGIKAVISSAIQQKHEYLKYRGFSRAAASATPAAPPPVNTPKPAPLPSAVPGGGAEPPNGVSAIARGLATALDRG